MSEDKFMWMIITLVVMIPVGLMLSVWAKHREFMKEMEEQCEREREK